jgi:hypothetical protein
MRNLQINIPVVSSCNDLILLARISQVALQIVCSPLLIFVFWLRESIDACMKACSPRSIIKILFWWAWTITKNLNDTCRAASKRGIARKGVLTSDFAETQFQESTKWQCSMYRSRCLRARHAAAACLRRGSTGVLLVSGFMWASHHLEMGF